MSKLVTSVLLVAALSIGGNANAMQMYASSSGGDIYAIDTGDASTTLLGSLEDTGATEIEFDAASGRAFAQLPNGDFMMIEITLPAGSPVGSAVPNGGAFNGLEFVGATLYGAYITES